MIKRIFFLGCFLYGVMSCNTEQNRTDNRSADTLQTTNSGNVSDEPTVAEENAGTSDSIVTQSAEEQRTVQSVSSDKSKPQPQARTQPEVLSQAKPAAPPSLKEEAKKFCDFFKTYEEPSQFYTVPALQEKEVKGNAGTIISVNPEDLTTLSNQPVEKPIEVELKELTKQEHLLQSNAQTVCKGRLLVSGGAYYVNLKSDGQQLKLKPGRALSIKFPKLTEAPMSLFTGYRDSLGQMQWQQRNQTFKPNGLQQAWRDSRSYSIQYDGDILEIDTLPKRKPKQKTEQEKQKDKAYEKLYAAMEVQSLGWINCDRFLSIPDKTTLSIQLDSKTAVPFASFYLIFDDINSIIQSHYGAIPKGVSNPGFQNIPVGAKARLVAFSLKNEKLLAYTTNITIKKNETMTVSLKDVSEEELRRLLGKK